VKEPVDALHEEAVHPAREAFPRPAGGPRGLRQAVARADVEDDVRAPRMLPSELGWLLMPSRRSRSASVRTIFSLLVLAMSVCLSGFSAALRRARPTKHVLKNDAGKTYELTTRSKGGRGPGERVRKIPLSSPRRRGRFQGGRALWKTSVGVR